MDALSEVLSLLRTHTYMAGGFDMGGAWSIGFSGPMGIKCYALLTGQCRLAVEGVPEPVQVGAGECFLLPRGLPFRLASDLSLAPSNPREVFGSTSNGRIATWNGGGACFGVGGHFAVAGTHARTILEELPPIVHIRSEAGRVELQWLLERMRQELQGQQPGAAFVSQHLAGMILVQALRLHLEGALKNRAGWLAALTDTQVRPAMTAMHGEPAQPWTVQQLAERCGMSRSTFAQRFKAVVRVSPMEYLARWRMVLAEHRLAASDDSIGSIGLALGYDSESAFSKAFRRVMQASPREIRRGAAQRPRA